MKFVGPDAGEPVTPRILIIAYGNPLRSDDGIAWRAADLLRRELSSDDVEIICVHQLTPELAESVSYVEDTIFLDARANGKPGKICWARVPVGAASPASTHILTPAQLMVLSGLLYGVAPRACEVSVTGESFAHGEKLSHKVKNALPRLVEFVDLLTRQILLGPKDKSASGAGHVSTESAGTIFEGNLYGNPHQSS
jgi:hydrogenase maturation protease